MTVAQHNKIIRMDPEDCPVTVLEPVFTKGFAEAMHIEYRQ